MPHILDPESSSTHHDEEEQLYRDLVETSQDLIWQCDAEGRYTDLNPAWEKTFGYTVEEMLGKKFTDFQTPDQAEKDMIEFRRLLDGNMVKGLRTIHLGKGNRELHLVFNAIYVHNEKGAVCGTRGTAHDITAVVESELKIAESQFFLHKAQEIGKIGHFSYDPVTGTMEGSDELYRIFNIDPATSLFDAFTHAVHPDERAVFLSCIEKAAREAIPYDIEHRILHHDGSVVRVISRGEVIDSPQGRRIVGIVQDITDQKQVEEKLRESEERLRSIIDAAPFGAHLYELDSEGRLVFTGANRSADRILGVGHDQFIGKTIAEAFPPLAATEIPERYATVAREGETYATEQVEYDHGGVKGAFDVRAVQTAPNHMAAFFADITESKKAEEALRRSERKFRAIFNSSFQFIGLLTPDGILIEVNDSALQFGGTTHEETVNRPYWETCWWRGNEERVTRLKEAIARCAKGEFIRYEVEQQGAGGKTATVDFSLKPVVDAEGTVTMLVPEGRDITELKNAESLLINSQRLESLGILAGGIAHDFNNLLTGMFGSVELAALEARDESIATYLATARTAIDRARNLTRQLLTFAKGGAPVKKPEAMKPFIEESVRFALSGSSISYRLDLQDGLWPCSIDRNQVGQVIDNIIINAEQSMPGGDCIVIAARNVEMEPRQHPVLRKGRYVKIDIVDRGVGIPREILPKIFDPFFSTKEKGHGLGLAMCYSIIHRHSGVIDVESEPGKGSIFTLYLPANPESTTEERTSNGISYKGKGTVLVMDDDELVRKTVGSMLETLGHSVESVSCGEEVVTMLNNSTQTANNVVAVILDLTIPGAMGGKETIRVIRNSNISIPVFVSSGYDEDPVLAQPEKYGFTASIRKPFLVAELAAMLEQYL